MGPVPTKSSENGYLERIWLMGPPKCRVCGIAEFGHLCGPVAASKLAGSVTRGVTKPKAVTARVPIMPVNNGTPEKKGRGRPKAVGTKAERQAAYRARKKEGA